jgi:hypothetical protein
VARMLTPSGPWKRTELLSEVLSKRWSNLLEVWRNDFLVPPAMLVYDVLSSSSVTPWSKRNAVSVSGSTSIVFLGGAWRGPGILRFWYRRGKRSRLGEG